MNPRSFSQGNNRTVIQHAAFVITALFLNTVWLCAQQPGPPANLRILGEGDLLLLHANPTSLSFGNVSTGTQRTLPVTFTSSGNNVTISNVNVSGAGFSASGVSAGQVLPPGQSATLNVTFAPTTTGSVAGSVTIASTAANSPTTIPLSGVGSLPGALTAFPGAQGAGALSPGGRGGTIHQITNTNDSGAGSLRACVQASGPRTCIFRTGGTIALQSTLTIANPFITIAGQTAPGGGIQLRGPSGASAPGSPAFFITTHDVVIQYLRVRRGHNSGEVCTGAWSCGANIVVLSNQPAHDPYNIILDHISSEWSNYEALIFLGGNSATRYPRSLVVSNSILGEALAGAGQTTIMMGGGYSGQGSTAPDGMTDIDFHHNLFAGSSHRLPLLTVRSARLVNNFVYGWTYYPMRSKGLRNFVGNYFKYRSGQGSVSHEIQAWATTDGNDTSTAPSFYVAGNIGPSDPGGTSNWSMTALSINQSAGEGSSPLLTSYRRTSPIPEPTGYVSIVADPVSSISSPTGSMLNTNRAAPYQGVGASRRVDCRGAWVDARDSVDNRIVNAVVNGTTLYGSYTYSSLSTSPQSQADLGGWPTLAAGTACLDSNSNGLPDLWEIYWAGVFGLGSILNPNGSSFGDGYTVLEHFIHGMSPSL
jgi:pectate lyase